MRLVPKNMLTDVRSSSFPAPQAQSAFAPCRSDLDANVSSALITMKIDSYTVIGEQM